MDDLNTIKESLESIKTDLNKIKDLLDNIVVKSNIYNKDGELITAIDKEEIFLYKFNIKD